MRVKLFHVDAFTDRIFSGNPAAVCILEVEGDKDWMQNVAMEMNLSETAFVYPVEKAFRLRWFTPKMEVDLCGHATLATAHILWEQRYVPQNRPISFHTQSGLITAGCHEGLIELDFPGEPATACRAPAELAQVLGVRPRYVGKNRFDYLVEVESERQLRKIDPDFRLLQVMPVRGVIVTSLSDSGEFDFVSRFFAPRAGIPEDPVTGSAHCCLAPYWSAKLNKDTFVAFQASTRGGTIRCRVEGQSVFLGGQAVTVMEGELIPGSNPKGGFC